MLTNLCNIHIFLGNINLTECFMLVPKENKVTKSRWVIWALKLLFVRIVFLTQEHNNWMHSF